MALSIPYSTCVAYPLNSCPRVIGVASCMWVRPILIIDLNSNWKSVHFCSLLHTLGLGLYGSMEIPQRRDKSLIDFNSSGNVHRSWKPDCKTLTKITYVSLEDWLLLTWSLGCTGTLEPIFPPSISIARFDMTSFTFMFVWVPDPVCQTTKGKWSNNLLLITSSEAWMIASAIPWSKPKSLLTMALA